MCSQRDTTNPTLFSPTEGMEYLSQNFDRLPRYLFRVQSTRSMGEITPTFVSSGHFVASRCVSMVDVLQMTKEQASDRIGAHLTWTKHLSDFVSWTSSFPFAVQMAFYKTIGKHDWEDEDRSTIRIYILDTHNIPRGSILPVVPLLNFYKVEYPNLKHYEYYAAEYLSQGFLDLTGSPMTTFTLGAMIKHNFLALESDFEDPKVCRQLASRLQDIRPAFNEALPGYKPQASTEKDLDIVCSIALNCCQDPAMRPVLMAALLSFYPRNRKDEHILGALRRSGWGKDHHFWYARFLLIRDDRSLRHDRYAGKPS
jgi:hypothetical protein